MTRALPALMRQNLHNFADRARLLSTRIALRLGLPSSLIQRVSSFRPSLLVTFSVVSFVLIGALAVGLAWGIQQRLEESALNQEATHAADLVNMYISPQMHPSDLQAPMLVGSPRYQQMDRLVRTVLLQNHIVRAKIWAKDGTIIYSDQPELIGQQFAVADDLQEAFAGKVHKDVSTLSDDENKFEQGKFDRLLELYIPLRTAGSQNFDGVFEVYHDLIEIDQRNNDLRGFIWSALGVGFLGLYGSLFALVRGASRTLIRRNRENEQLYQQASERLVERLKAETALQYRVEFESLIMSISTNFINLAPDEVDNGIRQALRAIGKFAGVDRSYIFQFDDGQHSAMSSTHEWCERGIVPLAGVMKNLPVSAFPWLLRRLSDGEAVHIPRVAELPPEASPERAFFQSVSNRSMLMVPMVYNMTLTGFLGLDFVHEAHAWSGESINLLKIVGEIFVNALQRKRAEYALRESEQRFRAVFEGTAFAIGLSDMDGHIVQSNQPFQEMVGYTGEDLKQMTFADITHPEDVNLNIDYFKQLFDGGIPYYGMEKRYVRRDGTLVWVNLLVSLLRDARGNPQFSLAMVQDITERKHSQEEIKRQLERLAALRSIDNAITASFDLHTTLEVILGQVTTQLHVDAADVLLINPHTGAVEYAAGFGFRGTEGDVRTEGKGGDPYSVLSPLPSVLTSPSDLTGEDFVAYYAVPLVAKGKVAGALELFHRSSLSPNAEWLDFLEALAGQTAIAVDNATLFQDLQRYNLELSLAYDTTLEGWSHALDLRDHETEGHTQRVTNMTVRLARSMGVGENDIIHIRRGALLHDIGKMGIPDAILLKPGPLTDDEWTIMRLHPVYAYELLSPIAFLHPALDIPYCHHEKWDGTGYPRGLKGEAIPMSARIFAVIDVYDALRSDRPYRAAWPEARVMEHILSLSGTHFDPQVVDAFARMDRTAFHRHPSTPELALALVGQK